MGLLREMAYWTLSWKVENKKSQQFATFLGTGVIWSMTSSHSLDTIHSYEHRGGPKSSIYCPCGFIIVQVMVWIHGGGLVIGGASPYNGLALSAHENVVVVTIQYRLGIWGLFR